MLFAARVSRAQRGSANPDDYATYTPTACVEAVQRTHAYHDRELGGFDTTRFDPEKVLAWHPDVLAVARACVERFHVATVHPRDLPALVSLYAILSMDTAAASAANRWLATTKSVRDTIDGLVQIAERYIVHRRPEPGRAILSQLKNIPDLDARFAEVRIYMYLKLFYSGVANDDLVRETAAQIIHIGKLVLAKSKDPSVTQRDYHILISSIAEAYSTLITDTVERGGGSPGVRAWIDRMKEDLGPDIVKRGSWETLCSMLDQPGPPLSAQYWFGSPRDSVYPSSGHPTLFVFQNRPRRTPLPALRRLKARFPELSIVVVLSTQGHFRGDGMLEDDVEAEYLRAYYLDELAFQGTLAVTQTEFSYLPDGRRRAVPPEGGYEVLGGVTLTDRERKVRRVYGLLDGITEWRVERAIQTYIGRENKVAE